MSKDIQNVPIDIDLPSFFKAFYPNDKTTIFFRTLSDREKNDNGKKYSVERRFLDGIIPTLTADNKQNRGVFFVVCGGGNTNKDVLASGSCTAQFMEIDDRPMQDQLKEINDFSLRPSIVVRTRKSLHCYWLLKNGDIKRFRGIQKQLIAKFHSDKAIKNESRVMRVPHFNHCKGDPVRVEVIHFEPELRYTQDEISSVLPEIKDNDAEGRTAANKITKDNSGKIPHGQRRSYLVQKAGELVNRLYQEDDTTITAALMNIARNDLDLSVPLVSGWEGLERDLSKIVSDFKRAKQKELEEGPAIDWKYNVRAWYLRNPGKELPTPMTQADWGKVRAAGDEQRAEEASSDQGATQHGEVRGTRERVLERLRTIHPELCYKWDDKGDGNLFADLFKNHIRWNTTSKQWYYYNGKIWKEDEGGMIASRYGKALADCLVRYASEIEDEEKRFKYMNHVLKLGQLSNRKRMLEDARDRHFVTAAMFDQGIYLLNLQNGVLDLKSGELLEHDPSLLLSKICNVSYDPQATCDRWQQYMDEVMQGSVEKINYLQKIVGYSLTGDTREETCFILYGKTTRNGKSLFCETICNLLGGEGGYGLSTPPEVLALKKNKDSRQASGDVARLNNCRFLNASEPPKKMIFDVGLLKTLLGRDSITARHLYEREFQFVPQFKLLINTNFLPLITDDTLFSSGRINVITFDRHFSEEEQDKTLKDRFRQPDEMSGILNWCLEGLLNYWNEGLKPPEAVRIATNDYRKQSDKMGLFVGEVLEKKSGHNLSAGKVYSLYQDWCGANGYGQENKSNFFAELKTRGMFLPSGTVNGVTVRNVVPGYDVSADWMGSLLPNLSPSEQSANVRKIS